MLKIAAHVEGLEAVWLRDVSATLEYLDKASAPLLLITRVSDEKTDVFDLMRALRSRGGNDQTRTVLIGPSATIASSRNAIGRALRTPALLVPYLDDSARVVEKPPKPPLSVSRTV